MVYKVILLRDDCIGCESCVNVCPDYWKMADDGMTTLIGGEEVENGRFELQLDKDRDCNEEAADVCPVEVILIEDIA